MRRRPFTGPRILAVLILATVPFLLSLVSEGEGGDWPYDWPVELEDVRAQTKTIDVGIGTRIYQIPFEGREQFEAAWLGILRAMSHGGTLTLCGVGSEGDGWPGARNEQPAVRIYAPSAGYARMPEPGKELAEDATSSTIDDMKALVEQGKALYAGEPWPESAHLPNGDLPEYVAGEWVDGRLTWVPATPGKLTLSRARVDIEVVVDGEVIDLNRIHLPADTKIIDKRGLAGSDD